MLASVNLEWFADEKVEEYIGGRGVEVMGVDGRGRLLFSYPRSGDEIGSSVLTAEMVGAMVNKARPYQIMKGHDGVYRVYSYKVVREEEPMLFLVGVSLVGFLPVILGVSGFMILAAGGSWVYLSWQYGGKGRGAKTRG